jgi:hypothetical protein
MMTTRARKLMAVVGLAILAAVMAQAGDKEPAAVLTATKGKVALVRDGAKVAPKLPCQMRPGDKLELAAGAQAVVIFPDRPSVRLEAKQGGMTWQAPAGGETAPREGVVGALWRWVVARLRPGERTTRTVAPISRGDAGQPAGYWPRDTLVSQSRPDFAWRNLPGATYQLVVMDRQGHELWTSDVVAAPHLTYPEDGPPLLPGAKYWWEVRAFVDDDIAASGMCWIQVATADQKQKLDEAMTSLNAEVGPMDETASAASKAFLLASQGFDGEALELLCGLGGGQPTDEQVNAWLEFLTTTPVEAKP